MSSCPSATGTPIAVSSRTGRCSGPVCGSLTKPSPARLASPARRSRAGGRRGRPRGRGWRRRGPRGRARASRSPASRWCAGSASPASSTSIATRRPCAAASAHIRRTCSRASASVCSIHGMPPTTSAPRSTASRTRSSAPGSQSSPSCGNATTWRSTTPRNSSRSASSGITPSSRALVSTSANASTWRTPYRTAWSTARAGVRLDPGPVVVGLHRRRELDRVQRRAHVAGGVRRQRGVADPVQRVHLVQVHVAVGEALGDQPPAASISSRPVSVSWC